MSAIHNPKRAGRRRPVRAVAGAASLVIGASLVLTACSGSGSPAGGGGDSATGGAANSKHLGIAYFAFAQQNSYQAPQIAAAKKALSGQDADVTLFDAANNAQKQFGQIQDALASGKYDGFLIDAVDGAGLAPLVKRALDQHITVVSLNQVLGPDLSKVEPQIPGVSASVVYTGYNRGKREGKLVEQACAAMSGECKVGYMFDIKASGFDKGVRAGLDSVISGNSRIKVVTEGEDKFTPTGGLAAAQTMLQAHSDLDVFVGSDQGMAGATQAVSAAGKSDQVKIIGLGGSVAGLARVKDGTWFGDVVAIPATQGRLAAQALLKALRHGVDSGGIDPSSTLPDDGIATKANVDKFHGEWTG